MNVKNRFSVLPHIFSIQRIWHFVLYATTLANAVCCIPRRRFFVISGFQKPVWADVLVAAVWLMWTSEVNYETFVLTFASVKRCLKNEHLHWTGAIFCRFAKKLFCPNGIRVMTAVLWYDVWKRFSCYISQVQNWCILTLHLKCSKRQALFSAIIKPKTK